MEEVLASGKDLLLNHFAGIRGWSNEEFCDIRRVWIECLGTPPHTWTIENIRRIKDVWGRMVCLYRKTKSVESLIVQPRYSWIPPTFN